MPLRENELARRTDAGLELRREPLRLKCEFPDLLTQDGHTLRCVFTASVQTISDRTERRMLEEVLLDGRSALTADDVARHFQPALRAAASRVAQSHDAKPWMESDGPRRELIEALKAAALATAFACGLEVLPPFNAELQSATYELQRARSLQQALAEKEAAGQVEHFQRAAELLKQFHVLQKESPELSAGQILQIISPADRGSLMQSLLMSGAGERSTAVLWAVAGPNLLRIDVRLPIEGALPIQPELIPLPLDCGPLRSVSIANIDGRPMLLVGAQKGFLLADIEKPTQARAYLDPGAESSLGFNRVVYWPARGTFCATHSEAGLVCWDADGPEKPAKTVRGPALGVLPTLAPSVDSPRSINMSMRSGSSMMGPRNLRIFDASHLLFSVGMRLMLWDGQAAITLAEPAASEIVGVWRDGNALYTVHEDGTLCEIDPSARKTISTSRRFGRVRAAGELPWLGGTRLLVANDEGPVQCIGSEDPLVTQFFSAYRGLRAVVGSTGVIAAVSPDRQRAILWNTWDGRQPAAELFVGALARHRIADIALS